MTRKSCVIFTEVTGASHRMTKAAGDASGSLLRLSRSFVIPQYGMVHDHIIRFTGKEVTKMNMHEEIEALARQLFEESGRAEGRDLDNWIEAERIIHLRHYSQETHESGSSS